MEEYSKISNEDLMFKFQSGDNLAFDELVRRFKQPLANFIFRFTSDYDESLDIVQQTFIKVYYNKHKYSSIAKFSTWIYTIAGNLAKTHLRKIKRLRFFSTHSYKTDDIETEIDLPSNELSPEESADKSIKSAIIQKCLNKLPVKIRQVLIFRDIMELSYDEISKIVKVPEGTVKSRINRGRILLKEYLDIYNKEF
jgi:RNA polymerase sigma-70 factor (ECF subfamily)